MSQVELAKREEASEVEEGKRREGEEGKLNGNRTLFASKLSWRL
jgi:hypothetical protein